MPHWTLAQCAEISLRAQRQVDAEYREADWPVAEAPKVSPAVVRIVLTEAGRALAEMGVSTDLRGQLRDAEEQAAYYRKKRQGLRDELLQVAGKLRRLTAVLREADCLLKYSRFRRGKAAYKIVRSALAEIGESDGHE